MMTEMVLLNIARMAQKLLQMKQLQKKSRLNFSVKIPYFNLPIKAIMKLANMAELRNLFFYGKDLLIMNLSAGNLHLTELQRN